MIQQQFVLDTEKVRLYCAPNVSIHFLRDSVVVTSDAFKKTYSLHFVVSFLDQSIFKNMDMLFLLLLMVFVNFTIQFTQKKNLPRHHLE